MTRTEALKRYPRLCAHLICDSLGYFTPLKAADAVAAHLEKRPCFCEWYDHMAGFRMRRAPASAPRMPYEQALMEVGRDALARAFSGRKGHRGYMASYNQAINLVKAELADAGCTSGRLASWF
jgi:hypothetical protein